MEPSAISPEDTLNGLGLDSLMAMELKLNIEKDLGIKLPVVNLLKGPTFNELSSQVLEIMTRHGASVLQPLGVSWGELARRVEPTRVQQIRL